MCVCARVRACVCLCVCPVPVYGCSVQTEKQMKHRAPSSCPARARALAERSLCARLCAEARLALTYTVLKERNHASSSTPCHSLAHGHPPRGTRCLCMRRHAGYMCCRAIKMEWARTHAPKRTGRIVSGGNTSSEDSSTAARLPAGHSANRSRSTERRSCRALRRRAGAQGLAAGVHTHRPHVP